MDKKEGEGDKVTIKLHVTATYFYGYSVSEKSSHWFWIRRNDTREKYVLKLTLSARILGTTNYYGFLLMIDREVLSKLCQLSNLDLRKKADRKKADILVNPQEKLPVEATAGMV
jgi:hypothetical protein